jgi:hypothetical protein
MTAFNAARVRDRTRARVVDPPIAAVTRCTTTPMAREPAS